MSSALLATLLLLWVIVLLNLLLTIGLIRRFNQMSKHLTGLPEQHEGLAVGTPAPDFQAKTLTGEIVTLANYAQKAVSFIFVSHSCEPCLKELPGLKALAPKAREAGVEMVLVNTEGDVAETETFVKKHALTLPVLVAPFENNSFLRDYRVSGTPFFCMLNRESKIEATGSFGPEWDRLARVWATG